MRPLARAGLLAVLLWVAVGAAGLPVKMKIIDHLDATAAAWIAASPLAFLGHGGTDGPGATLAGGPEAGGNLVLIASDAPLNLTGLSERMAARQPDWSLLTGPELAAWIGDAPVLTDDYAPVDQLLTPYPAR